MDLRFLAALIVLVCATNALPSQKLDLRNLLSILEKRQDDPAIDAIKQFCKLEGLTEEECKKHGTEWYEGYSYCLREGHSKEDCVYGIKTCINEFGKDSPEDCGELWEEIESVMAACMNEGYSPDFCIKGIKECEDKNIEIDNCLAYHEKLVPSDAVDACMKSNDKLTRDTCYMGIRECTDNGVSLDKCGVLWIHHKKKAETPRGRFKAAVEGCSKLNEKLTEEMCENGILECMESCVELDKCEDFHKNKALEVLITAVDYCVKETGLTEEVCKSKIQECMENNVPLEKCGEYHAKQNSGGKKRVFSKISSYDAFRRRFLQDWEK